MTNPSFLTAKHRCLPRLLIDSSMDYRSSSSSLVSLSDSVSTTGSSSLNSRSSGGSMLVRGIYDFDGSGEEQISFQSGEVLEVIYRDSSGWWAAHREDDDFIGWIPGSYVEPLSQGSSGSSQGSAGAWETTSAGACFSPGSQLLDRYEHQALALSLSPDGLNSPGSIGTRSKAISPSAESILGEAGAFPMQFSLSPSTYGRMKHSCQSPEVVTEGSPAQAGVYSAGGLRKLCPSSPSSPPPPPPTAAAAPLPSGSHVPEDVHSATTSVSEFSPNLSPDSYASCHPHCAHRRLLRLDDGLYFRPLSVLLEATSIHSDFEDEETDASSEPVSPDEPSRSYGSLSRRGDKIKQITGDDVAQAVHAAKAARATRPWYLTPISDESEIRYDHDGTVIAATLPALVESLTAEPLHPSHETHLRHAFFSTFRTMGTPDEVFDLLLSQYYREQPLGLTGSEADCWRMRLLYPTQRRVLAALRTWLVDHRMIEDDPSIARRLQAFLPEVAAPPENAAAAAEVMTTLERLTFAVPPNPVAKEKPHKRRKTSSKHELLRLDVTALAENLSLYENMLYSKVRPQECLKWISVRTGEPVANLLAFCTLHDKLGAWVKHSILWTDGLGRRADLIDFWIKVAEKCRSMRNYSSMSAIVTALSSSVISRLHLSWAHVGRGAHLEAMVQLNDPAGNFSAFRSAQRSVDGPCVPFVGPYLTDIMHINDQHIDTAVLTGKGSRAMFNIVKRRKWTDVLDAALCHQGKVYPFPQDPAISGQIESSLTVCSAIEQATFWARSEEVQQAERASADVRRGLEAAGF